MIQVRYKFIKTSGYHTGLCTFSTSDAGLAYMRSFSIKRGCADRTGFYTDLAVSYKLDSFRKLNPGIQEESLEFPLLKGSAGKITGATRLFFPPLKENIDRQVSIFVSGNNPANSAYCFFSSTWRYFWFYLLVFWLYSSLFMKLI